MGNISFGEKNGSKLGKLQNTKHIKIRYISKSLFPLQTGKIYIHTAMTYTFQCFCICFYRLS